MFDRFFLLDMLRADLQSLFFEKSDKFGEEKEYIEIAKEKGGQKRSRFNINPKYVRMLGEALVKFADENKL